MRPRRIYKEGNRFYYLINGKKRYIKITEDVTDKQVVRANLKRIDKPDQAKRVKPKEKRREEPFYRFEKPIINGKLGEQLATPRYYNPLLAVTYPTASSRFVEQGKNITSIEDIITGAQRKKREKFGEDITEFFSELAKKKNELFANITITQSPGTLTNPTTPDLTKDDIDVSSKDVEISDDNYKTAVINIINDVDDFTDYWGKDEPSYQATLNSIIRGRFTELADNEDRRKSLLLKLREDKQLKDLYDLRVKQIQEMYMYRPGKEETVRPPREINLNAGESKEEGPLQESKGDDSFPPVEPTRPQYQKPGGKPFLRTGQGTLASSGVKPLTTEEKLATTPSYSGTPQGTEGPAVPLSSTQTTARESPMPVSYVEQLRKEMGFGQSDIDNGLYNDQIATIIRKRVGKIIPVVPSDKVNDLLSYVVKGDKKFSAVINTNPSTSDGSGEDGHRPGHWRAIFIDTQDDFPSCEYFDPLAEGKPEKSLVDVMKKISKKMNPEKLCLYKQNNIRRQAKDKSTCGWHVVQFIDDRWNGVPWSKATGYDDYMSRLEQPVDDSNHGENKVEKYIKKYEVYI